MAQGIAYRNRSTFYAINLAVNKVENINSTTARIHWSCNIQFGNWYLWGVRLHVSVDGVEVGSWAGACTYSGQVVINVSGTRDVARTGSARSVRVSAWSTSETVNGYGGVGTTTSCYEDPRISQRTYDRPKKPKNFSVSKASDYSQRLTWQGDYTDMNGAYPWTNVRVNRNMDNGGRQNISVLRWDAVNYTDNSTKPGHKYDYDVQSTNQAGTSDMAGPITVYTTPTAPTRVSAVKKSNSLVEVTLSGHSRWWDSVETQVSSNGGSSWQGASSTASASGNDIKVNITTLPAGTVVYRLRIVKSGMYSGWVKTGNIVTIVAPSAPSISVGGSVYKLGDTASVSWVPNHPDGSAQQYAQAEFTIPNGSGGTTTKIIEISGGARSASIETSIGAVGTWSVRVRTKGLDPSWGAWSNSVSFRVALAPQIWFSKPGMDGELVTGMPATAEWVVSDTTGVSSQEIFLLDSGGNVIVRERLSGSARSWTFGTYDDVKNKDTYTLRIDITAGSGLTDRATRSFATEWPEPAAPFVKVTYDDALSAHIKVEQGTSEYYVQETALCGPILFDEGRLKLGGFISATPPAGQLVNVPATKSFSITRVMPDGTRMPVANGLKSGQSAIDPLPPLNTDFIYEVTAYAESGQSNLNPFKTRCHSRFATLNFGLDAGEFVKTGYNAEFDCNTSHSREMYHFASGKTNSLPVRYDLDDTDVNMRASWTVIDRDEAIRVRNMSRSYSWGWFRDLDGNMATVAVDIDISRSTTGIKSWNVSASMVESVWEEPVNGDV